MGRGVSAGGGQSSLGYLFGSGEPASNVPSANQPARTQNASAPPAPVEKPSPAPVAPSPAPVERQSPVEKQSPAQVEKQIPAGIPGSLKNNYHRADGQNCGNFLTKCFLLLECLSERTNLSTNGKVAALHQDRPSTKVHAAPGGGSSLGYLFGGPPGN
ncbi:hypothetical protein ACSQ67_008391 [Phaseolus vulgaris]